MKLSGKCLTNMSTKTVLSLSNVPEDLKGSWARRESVYGIKGLRGPELDLQKRCTAYLLNVLRRLTRWFSTIVDIVYLQKTNV